MMHTQLNTGEHFIGGNYLNNLPNFLSIFHFLFFMEQFFWVFPSDDAQTNNTFCAVDCCPSGQSLHLPLSVKAGK